MQFFCEQGQQKKRHNFFGTLEPWDIAQEVDIYDVIHVCRLVRNEKNVLRIKFLIEKSTVLLLFFLPGRGGGDVFLGNLCKTHNMQNVLTNHWICVRTEAHKEAFAEGNLRKAGLEVYCPRFERWISHARRRQLVLRPLFPNYLFVRSDVGLEGLGSVKRTPGVSTLAARDLASSTVPDAVIELVRAREDQSGAVVFAVERFKAGETVRVTAGPFTDFEAVFAEGHDERRCRILLSMLGKQHSVLVLSHFLEKAS